jgi:dihydrofolate reductase
MGKTLNLIAACSENRVIGRNGRLPWRIPEDMAFFHRATAGHICVLGRICYETWPGARAADRRPVVVTRRRELEQPGVQVAATLPDALARAEALPGEIYLCGGQRIFEETFALTRPLRLHLTLIHAEIAGDRFFPEWRQPAWRETARRESADANFRYTFLTLER